MNRFQVSSVAATTDTNTATNGDRRHMAAANEVQLNAYNLMSATQTTVAATASANGGAQSKATVPVTIIRNGNVGGNGGGATGIDVAGSSSGSAAGGNGAQRRSSIAQLTREALPRLDNYRRSIRALKRPSLGLLHGEALDQQTQDAYKEPEEQNAAHTSLKLGWIQGVLIPCLLNIWGVMLFLRISWMVAQAGITMSLLIIAISATVCVITTLSLSAICTNGDVKGGGIYYIISRSLGPEFGASVGIVFAVANAVAASMNTIGFCDSLNELLGSFDLKIIDGGIQDTRIIGTVALAIMILICAVGVDWASKAQNILIVIIVFAMLNFMIGASIGPNGNEEAIAKGFEGFSSSVFAENWGSNYKFSEGKEQTFFTVFSIFFPSVTGIQAGANISGDLKDPASAIPKGTLLALLLSMISYVLFVFFSGGAAFREASGNVSELINGSMVGVVPSCLADNSCPYGLHNSYSIMQLMSLFAPLIYAGCFAATLSTALTNLLSVPRLIQALGKDRIYPGLIYFAKGYGKNGEPYRGYVLTFVVSFAFIMIGQLNVIAPLISTFYLASYALINFCTFHAAFVRPLGWRPTFKYYNVWLSLAGFAGCVTIMFLMDWMSSLITLTVIFALYLIVVYRKPDVNWGSTTQAQTYKTALTAALRLQSIGDHVKNYRPQVLVLAGSPHMRPPLVDLGSMITKNHSLMVVGDVITKEISYKMRQLTLKEGRSWLEARKIKAFYDIVQSADFETGVGALLQTSGVGKLSPNITLMGYKKDWMTCETHELNSYFSVMHKSFSYRMAVAILRMPEGLDYSHLNVEVHNAAFSLNDECLTRNSSTSNFGLSTSSAQATGDLKAASQLMHADSNLNLAGMASTHSTITTSPQPPTNILKKHLAQQLKADSIVYRTQGGSLVPKETLDAIGLFHNKQNKGTIDVWWLYDDGGLTMLIPYIISIRSTWSACKIRIFALTNHKMEMEVEERNMANLLNKLRIDYSSLTMLQGMSQKPSAPTVELHNRLLDNFREGYNTDRDSCVSDTELATLSEKTNRQLRLRELLLEHSTEAALVVMSLPMPRQDAVSAALYMSWLEVLTRDMPPFLLIRGNQNPVLTFYS